MGAGTRGREWRRDGRGRGQDEGRGRRRSEGVKERQKHVRVGWPGLDGWVADSWGGGGVALMPLRQWPS